MCRQKTTPHSQRIGQWFDFDDTKTVCFIASLLEEENDNILVIFDSVTSYVTMTLKLQSVSKRPKDEPEACWRFLLTELD